LGDTLIGAVGIGVAEEQAFAIGQTAMPSPISEQDWDGWIYWHPLVLGSMATTMQNGNAGYSVVRMPIDSRAMRKLDLGDTIFCSIEFGAKFGTITVDSYFDSRCLFKLP
jgi:hypothetical protein